MPSVVTSIFDIIDGHVPLDSNDTINGLVPLDQNSVITIAASSLEHGAKSPSALVFIEELTMVDLPAARSLDRLGVTTCPPVAFIGVARRWCFNPEGVTISATDTGLADDFLESW